MENNNTNIVGTVASNPTHVLPSSDSTDATNTDEQEKDLFSDTQESKESKKQEKDMRQRTIKRPLPPTGKKQKRKRKAKKKTASMRKNAENRNDGKKNSKKLRRKLTVEVLLKRSVAETRIPIQISRTILMSMFI